MHQDSPEEIGFFKMFSMYTNAVIVHKENVPKVCALLVSLSFEHEDGVRSQGQATP